MANIDVDAIPARYHRSFTVLGIGQDTSGLIAKWASLYPDSVFIILSEKLEHQAAISSQMNTIWLNHRLLLKEAHDLASCEHVDILLVCNAFSEFGEKWKEALQCFQQMAHIVIVQEADTINILENPGASRLLKTTLIHPRKTRRTYEVYSDYDHKYLKKIRPNWTATDPWLPGINLMTFLLFNGAIPSRSQILAHLPLDQQHSDWVPNNMIIQGQPILLIDQNDPTSTPVSPDGGRRFRDMESKIRTFISTTSGMSPSQVRNAFISIYNWGKYFDQTEIEE